MYSSSFQNLRPEQQTPSTPTENNVATHPTPAGTYSPNRNRVLVGDIFGRPHGVRFSDTKEVSSGVQVITVTIRARERVDAVGLRGLTYRGRVSSIYHGGDGGEMNSLMLAVGEYVVKMEVHWGKHNGHTRIMFVAFTTCKGNTISGGTMTKNIGIATAPEGFNWEASLGLPVTKSTRWVPFGPALNPCSYPRDVAKLKSKR